MSAWVNGRRGQKSKVWSQRTSVLVPKIWRRPVVGPASDVAHAEDCSTAFEVKELPGGSNWELRRAVEMVGLGRRALEIGDAGSS